MNSNALVNRLEVVVYSTLTSAISRMNKLRGKADQSQAIPECPEFNDETVNVGEDATLKPEGRSISLEAIKTIVIALTLWLILGFGAGFLLGMIKPW